MKGLFYPINIQIRQDREVRMHRVLKNSSKHASTIFVLMPRAAKNHIELPGFKKNCAQASQIDMHTRTIKWIAYSH